MGDLEAGPGPQDLGPGPVSGAPYEGGVDHDGVYRGPERRVRDVGFDVQGAQWNRFRFRATDPVKD